ncbi:receptor-type tyrosine-protein phosphatase eta [Talpa occidentalis]|uniref:receptor-type tyrosine-protein phosphatase eta n=1 Tax=Talpa occidentalis TaxID=50954 RepID=UPI0023F7BE95|nr:receptor-type tyrosine-protein phosphatase eta [Talpa occidentalis]
MSPGKPGAGGARTRRTGWSRRRRRRRRGAATRPREPGRTAGPDSRVPGSLQGARGMKPAARAAREARPPPRWPGLRRALPPLLLLLRLGQVLCAGECNSCDQITFTSTAHTIHFSKATEKFSVTPLSDSSGGHQWPSTPDSEGGHLIKDLTPGTRYLVNFSDGCCVVQTKPSPVFGLKAVSIGPTVATLTWENNDTDASQYMYRVRKKHGTEEHEILLTNQTQANIKGLRPGTPYTFSITPEMDRGILGNSMYINVTTELNPVSDLRAAFVGVTQAVLTWRNNNGTATCWMLLEDTKHLPVNISELKPGVQYNVILNFSESNGTQTPPVVQRLDVNHGENSTAPGFDLAPAHPASYPLLTQHTEVTLMGLEADTAYNVSLHSQTVDGMEGLPLTLSFQTKSSRVFDITIVNISATSLTLTWKINDNASSYSYKIQVVGETYVLNFTTNVTQAVIAPLESSTFYNITVCPFLGHGSAGTPGFLQVYTPPRPVSNAHVTNVSTREIGLAWDSNDANFFKIKITKTGTGEFEMKNTTNRSIVIGDLYPGTNYCFEIVPQGPNGTEGESQTVCGRTDFSAVFNISVVNVMSTEMHLEWQNTDRAPGYSYHLVIVSQNSSLEKNSTHTAITLSSLVPGILYSITISPELDKIQGNSSSIEQYTRPSNVSDIEISTNTTAATFTWKNMDKAAPTYTYHLFIEGGENSSDVKEVVTGVGITSATVAELTPGASYTVRILTKVGNATKSLESARQSFCTDPAPVTSFECEMVPKKPTLVLKWTCPDGINAGFQLEISSGAWSNVTSLDNCSLDNGTEYRMEVTYLNFSTSYNISITALSCNKVAPPAQNTCLTSITDPPPPYGSPNITSVSHYSVKVKFSGFEASRGPLKAYAVILTTGEAPHATADVLNYTYEDFKKGTSDTYVTYLITTGDKRHSQGLSEVLRYEVDVGNESKTHGYYNGRLEPLGSYRACVAGFTSITFNPRNAGLIDGAQSYVSFSRYSDAVFLPQDPGVICGAVFGCIFGALAIVSVGGFIFWRKKRKDAKNNELSFSQIKPKKSKLIKVENFEAYFKKQQADSNCGFAEEYEDLKLVGIGQPKYTAELAENRGKNRYNNVLPYDISRVKLSVQTHSTDDYINANYMPGYHSRKDFIATQGPLPNTLKDFWRMVWEKNVYAIVMLTKCVEQGRTKCEEYWPSKKAQDYGDIIVANTSEIVLPEWTIRDFTVKNIQTSESHPLRQFHFTSWPDHGVPDTTDLLINFRYLVRDYMKQSPPESPVLVHCSAGVGRTGTFIAIDRLIYQIENENSVDVYGIVYDLRMHRPLMVQTEDQYVFLNQCVLDIIRSQKDSKVDLIYQNTTAMTIYENLSPVTAFGKTNGYIA